jgi:hypothetical protein
VIDKDSHKRKIIGLASLLKIGDLAIQQHAKDEGYPFIFHFSFMVIKSILRLLCESDDQKAQLDKWILTEIFPTSEKPKSDYLRSEWNDEETKIVHIIRVRELAELLYNLQTIRGSDQIYRRIITDRRNVEATLFELEGYRLLCLAKLNFRMRSSGYEATVLLDSGETVHLEMKCKVGGTGFSETTIKNSIDKAQDQLPKDSCGVMLLKTPYEWCENESTRARFYKAIDNELRKTDRIAEILVYSSIIHSAADFVTSMGMIKEILNPGSPYVRVLGTGLIGDRIENAGPWWVSFGPFSKPEVLKWRIGCELGVADNEKD